MTGSNLKERLQNDTHPEENKKYRKYALWSFLGPVLAIVVLVVVRGLFQMLVAALGAASWVSTVLSVFQAFLPLLIGLSVLALFIGIVLAIVFFIMSLT